MQKSVANKMREEAGNRNSTGKIHRRLGRPTFSTPTTVPQRRRKGSVISFPKKIFLKSLKKKKKRKKTRRNLRPHHSTPIHSPLHSLHLLTHSLTHSTCHYPLHTIPSPSPKEKKQKKQSPHSQVKPSQAILHPLTQTFIGRPIDASFPLPFPLIRRAKKRKRSFGSNFPRDDAEDWEFRSIDVYSCRTCCAAS